MLKPTVLIVDDEKPTREGLRAALEDRYDVYIAEDGEGALRLLEEDGYDVLLTDLRMPGIGGLDLIKRAKSLGKPPICILMTAYGSEEMAVDAMRQGADDYIAKGRLQIDELEMRIARAVRSQKLESENRELRSQVDTKFGLENVIGQSPAMEGIFEIVQQVAPARASVLVLGESGTGKELIAARIHFLSGRWDQPFVKIKDYFGEKIGLYFVFLGHYTEQAGVAAIIGVIVWLAACLTGGVNSPVIPFFCVVMSVWATVFLETWKRKQSRYAMEWGMVGIEEIEEERPDFLESDLVIDINSPVDGEEIKYFPPNIKARRNLIAWTVILVASTAVMALVIATFFLKAILAVRNNLLNTRHWNCAKNQRQFSCLLYTSDAADE
mgnify:CR=1 FL=1